MQVFGLNASGEFNPFKRLSDSIHGIGYRLEVAYIVPQRTTLQLTQSALPALSQMPGEYDYQGTGHPGGNPPAVVESTPFLKWTLGLDYTFGSHVYVNAQWVHGLVDEFGAGDWMHPGWSVRQSNVNTGSLQTGALCVNPKPPNGAQCATETMLPRLGDYLVLGADFKFLEDALLFRLFTIWDMSGVTTSQYDMAQGKQVPTFHSMFTKEGFSASIYPSSTTTSATASSSARASSSCLAATGPSSATRPRAGRCSSPGVATRSEGAALIRA